MADKTTPKAPGAINPGAQDYWRPLVEVKGITLNADPQSGQAYTTYEGQPVFVIPTSGRYFQPGRPFVTSNQIISMLKTKTPAQTKIMEKELGLKPTGISANPELVQRYMSEAMKASVNNVAIRNAIVSQQVTNITEDPLDVTAQAKLSMAAGDISTGPRRSRSVSITQFSEGDARAILEQFYADTLGRRPDDAEVKKFNAAINKQARKQPSVSTTTYDSSGSATTVSGGAGYSQADAQMAARKMAEADPEASSFLASTRYMDAFMNAIGSQA